MFCTLEIQWILVDIASLKIHRLKMVLSWILFQFFGPFFNIVMVAYSIKTWNVFTWGGPRSVSDNLNKNEEEGLNGFSQSKSTDILSSSKPEHIDTLLSQEAFSRIATLRLRSQSRTSIRPRNTRSNSKVGVLILQTMYQTDIRDSSDNLLKMATSDGREEEGEGDREKREGVDLDNTNVTFFDGSIMNAEQVAESRSIVQSLLPTEELFFTDGTLPFQSINEETGEAKEEEKEEKGEKGEKDESTRKGPMMVNMNQESKSSIHKTQVDVTNTQTKTKTTKVTPSLSLRRGNREMRSNALAQAERYLRPRQMPIPHRTPMLTTTFSRYVSDVPLSARLSTSPREDTISDDKSGEIGESTKRR